MQHLALNRGLRSTREELPFVLLVNPDGDLVVQRFQVNIMPTKCSYEDQIGPGGRIVARHVTGVKSKFYDLGWRLLDDLCKAEGREQDCESIYQWHREAQRRGGHRRKLKALDSAYLPDAVHEMRLRAKEKLELPLPPPQKKAKTSASKSRVSAD